MQHSKQRNLPATLAAVAVPATAWAGPTNAVDVPAAMGMFTLTANMPTKTASEPTRATPASPAGAAAVTARPAQAASASCWGGPGATDWRGRVFTTRVCPTWTTTGVLSNPWQIGEGAWLYAS
jgi:hypothetical protein